MRISDWSSDVCSSDLFGPSKEENYGAWGEKTAAVRTDLRYDEILAQKGYDHRRQDSHLLTLSVDNATRAEIGRAACRVRVCQSVLIEVVAGTLKKKRIVVKRARRLIYPVKKRK